MRGWAEREIGSKLLRVGRTRNIAEGLQTGLCSRIFNGRDTPQQTDFSSCHATRVRTSSNCAISLSNRSTKRRSLPQAVAFGSGDEAKAADSPLPGERIRLRARNHAKVQSRVPATLQARAVRTSAARHSGRRRSRSYRFPAARTWIEIRRTAVRPAHVSRLKLAFLRCL